MNFTIPFLLSYLSFKRDNGNTTAAETVSEPKTCSPDLCVLLKEFGAMKDKLGDLENRLKESEIQIHELKNKGNIKFRIHLNISV